MYSGTTLPPIRMAYITDWHSYGGGEGGAGLLTGCSEDHTAVWSYRHEVGTVLRTVTGLVSIAQNRLIRIAFSLRVLY